MQNAERKKHTAHLWQSDLHGLNVLLTEMMADDVFLIRRRIVYTSRMKNSIRRIYGNQTSIQAEVVDNTLSVSPTFLDFYPALKIDFTLEEILHIGSGSC